ncbi:MAG: dihydroneopterin aldolase [Tannerella sp.]|jgi:dihydroneopterin aldolase|nr:dihydroneopterin aldolase [Tannerella sp.]
MKVAITLESMKFHAYHGVMEQEQIIGGTYFVDLSYIIDTESIESDDIMDTISYAEIFDIVKQEMSKPSKLIEHVAGRILKSVKNNFTEILSLTVKVSKLYPPTNGEAERATVIITADKTPFDENIKTDTIDSIVCTR